MSTIKTLKVTFNGKEYQIRRNMYTMHLFANELKKYEAENDEIISTIIFAYCALKGFNKDFDLSFEDVAMSIDDPENESLVIAIAELFNTEEKEESAEEVDSEKK